MTCASCGRANLPGGVRCSYCGAPVTDGLDFEVPAPEPAAARVDPPGTARRAGALGTTGKGIGPAYVDRVGRVGLRAGDLRDLPHAKQIIAARGRALAAQGIQVDADAETRALERLAERIVPHVKDTVRLLFDLLRGGKRVLAEGAQGSLLDVTLGTYLTATLKFSGTETGAVFGTVALACMISPFFVGLVEAGKLGGGRFSGTR